MRRFLLAAAAVLSLGACADASSSPLLEPGPPSFASGDTWYLVPNPPPPDPAQNASPGWEVATQFYTTRPVCVMYLRFYRAVGETGTNRIKLWRAGTGQLILSRAVQGMGPGWQTEYVSSIVCLEPNTFYRVSVNTNTAQVKKGGFFLNGPIASGPLVATSGYYGQPTGSMPATHSYSYFYVDLIAVEQ